MTSDGKAVGALRAFAVVSAPCAAFLVVYLAGFFAASDDDYARTVIAQQFARAPAWDPSGTSWLPFPFWITGGAMSVFGRSLAVAKALALVWSVAAALCIHRTAVAAGASQRTAAASAVLAFCLPTTARLGSSLQPEVLTAALVFVALATTLVAGWPRAAGGAAVLAATLCRYEAWPVAALFAALCVRDALFPSDERRFAYVFAAALAVLGPALWMLHGAVHHHDALFFLHRVAAYRRALGESAPLRDLLAYPRAALIAEPELCAAFAAACFVAWQRGAPALSWQRPLLVLSSLVVFLIAGQLLDGAPTHHVERPLLPVFWAMVVFVVAAVQGRDWRTLAAVAALAAVAGIAVRSSTTADSYAPRAAERDIGKLARKLGASALVVDTPDYGYLAVIADFRAPERAVPLLTHDPRAREAPPFESAESLRAAVAQRCPSPSPCWFVAHADHVALASALGTPAGASGPFTLFAPR